MTHQMFCCRYVAVESLCVIAEKPKFKKGLQFSGPLKHAIFSHIISCPVEPGAHINVRFLWW